MLANAPPVGTPVVFRDGIRKPKEWTGKIIAHVPDDDGWGDGVRIAWPTMRYLKRKGCVTFNPIPSYHIEEVPRET
jgi:hypothetical protein